MGLLYQFPIEENELDDRIVVDTDLGLNIKNYGLPMLFWGYLAAIIMVISFMLLAIYAPLLRLIETDDVINKLLGIIVFLTIFSIPSVLLAFFFYEKSIFKNESNMTITQKVFWIPFSKTKIDLLAKDAIVSDHFMDSPNMAKIYKPDGMKGFENRGYFELFAVDKNQRKYLIDRNSNKTTMKKLRELLIRY